MLTYANYAFLQMATIHCLNTCKGKVFMRWQHVKDQGFLFVFFGVCVCVCVCFTSGGAGSLCSSEFSLAAESGDCCLWNGCSVQASHCCGVSCVWGRVLGPQSLQLPGSRAQTQSLWPKGLVVVQHVGPGIKPQSPALAGRSFIPEPPGKPKCHF